MSSDDLVRDYCQAPIDLSIKGKLPFFQSEYLMDFPSPLAQQFGTGF